MSNLTGSALNDDWDPEDDGFVEDVVLGGIVTFVIGFAVLCAFCIYYSVRCFCWICLDDECCDKRNRVRASQDTRKINNMLVTVLLIVCIGAGAWMLYAGTPIVDSLDSLTDKLREEVDWFLNNATNTIETIENNLPPESSTDLSDLLSAQTSLQEARDDIYDVEGDVRDGTRAFHGLIVTMGVAALVCAILGLLCVYAESIVFLYLFFIVGTVAVFALWVLGGLGLIGHEAFSETCEMMDLYADGHPNQYVLDKIPCDDLSKANDAVTEAQVAANIAVQESNAAIQMLNSQITNAIPNYEPVPIVCDPYLEQPAGSGMYLTNNVTDGCVQMEPTALEAAYGTRVCTAELSGSPNPSDPLYQACIIRNQPIPQASYDTLVRYAGAIVEIEDALPTIQQFATCGFLDAAFERIVESECSDLKRDANRLAVAALIAAISLTLTSFYFCICIQNIRTQDAPRAADGHVIQPGEEGYVEHSGKIEGIPVNTPQQAQKSEGPRAGKTMDEP